MTQRVLLGNRNGAYGLWVSKPGQDVLTATEFMLATDRKSLQIVARGAFTSSHGSTTPISWSPLGFRPLVLAQSMNNCELTYTSDDSANIYIKHNQSNLNAQWNVGSVPTLSSTVYWSVLAEVS